MFLVRQGDVLIKSYNKKIPKEYEVIPAVKNENILAYGEATGHKHALSAKNTIMAKIDNKVILMVIKPCLLTHQEHSAIKFPVGNYEVVQQREYTPEGYRNVAD